MGRNTSVSLGPHFEEFITSKLETGGYKNASEVVRAGLRLLEEREEKIQILRKALSSGINSGFVNNFDPDDHLKQLQRRRKETNG